MRGRFGAFTSPTGLFRSQSSKDIDKKDSKRHSMGNVPSLQEDDGPVPSGPQRLTKPRTNTNSAHLGIARQCSDSNKFGSSKASSPGVDVDYDESPLAHSHESPLQRLSPDDVYSQGFPAASVPNLTRASGSFHSTPSVSKRHSVAVDGSELDISAAIALLQELKKNASPEDLIALHKALLPTRSVDPEMADPISEAQEPVETISPLIRRSSLLPAGVATRVSLEALKRKPGRHPSQQERRRSASQVGRQQDSNTWDQFVEGGFDALDQPIRRMVPRPGAATPSDCDITHTGTYQLGSLRIMNGAASPEPNQIMDFSAQSGGMRDPTTGPAAPDGFAMANEGESVSEAIDHKLNSMFRSSPQSRSLGSRVLPKTVSTPPLTISTGSEQTHGRYVHQSPRASPRTISNPRLQQRAPDMAQAYITECEVTPDVYTENVPLAVQETRLSTVEDNSPVNETNGTPNDALKKLTGVDSPMRSRQASGASDSSASRPDLDRTYLQAPRRSSMQAKIDSGYNSEVSGLAQAEAQTDNLNIDDTSKTAVASPRGSMDGEPRAIAITADQPQSLDKSPLHERPAVSAFPSNPASVFPSATPSTNVTPSASAQDIRSSKSQKQPKKLQKIRPRTQSPQQVEVQAPVEEVKEEALPSVPDNVQVNFSRRLVQKPGMSHLDQTYTSVDETIRKEAGNSPTASDGLKQLNDEDRGRGRSAKTDSDTPKGEKRRSFLSRLRSRSRSKSRRRSPEAAMVSDEPMPNISDFGTVTQSLGESPYDIAVRQSKAKQSFDASRPQLHPHQISSKFARPFASMDDETAAQYARSKSRDVAEQQANDRRARSLSRSRRNSEHAIAKDIPVPVTPESSSSKTKHMRSASALPSATGDASSSSNEETPMERPRPYRVGTIKFEGGEAQGRLSPVMMERPKTRRRAQSLTPRARRALDESEGVKPLQETIPEVPGMESPSKNAQVALPDSKKDEVEVPVSPSQTALHPGWPGWETQARLWRERNQNIGKSGANTPLQRHSIAGEVPTPVSEKRRAYDPSRANAAPASRQQQASTQQTPRHSPSIVVSRYITPTSAEMEAHIDNIKSDDPYARYHAPNPADHIAAQEDVDRTDSAISYMTSKSTSSYMSYHSAASSPVPYSNPVQYRAYRPGDPLYTPRPAPSEKNMHNRSQQLSMRRSYTTPAPDAADVAFDRYSGGMGYGWERGNGFGGSAGTRQGSDQTAKRRSVQLSNSYGVDLSDVPVFLVRG
ncbi:hypothetical protein AAFC00_003564 [Neodothiora populina]|uniref:Proteophosphoglycan ppg4 n=1 Tax=Neodothiora populina TaxID=2781224 RepID=A0ABR3PET7_9PEZI